MARPTSRVTQVRVVGPLAPFADAYKTKLKDRGYTPLTTVQELRQLGHLSRWLDAAVMSAADVTSERLEQFVLGRRGSARGRGACSLQGLLPLLEVLRDLGVVDGEQPAPACSVSEALIDTFHRYLISERGLVASTANEYAGRARRFLDDCAPDAELHRLTTADVTNAVLRAATTMPVASVQHFVVALRSFLRFCFVTGLVDTDLSAAALSMTGRRRTMLPKGISRSDAAALLRSCDRRRSIGRRDYAVLLLLQRLALRAGEVARLTLDDIDWRVGEIVVRGKGGRVDHLPLPADVGEAIVAYLRRGRPPSNHRELFLRSLAPVTPLCRGGVSCVVRRACRRAGIPEVGAHALRHTVGYEMAVAGAPLPEIGELLRHGSIASAAIYARVDVETLRAVALPWLGGEGR